jgi:hypothetical protein
MFVVAATKDDRPIHLPGLDCHVFCRGSWTITVGASSAGVQVTSHGNGFSLVESPLAGAARPMELPVATVELAADCTELRITKPLYSGRPIYFHQNEAGEFFCSTRVARLRDCGVRLQPDEAALPEFLLYRYLVPPTTLYKSIQQLPLGARLRVELTPEGCAMGKVEHWSASEPGQAPPPEELAEEMVRRLMARL